MGRSKIHGLYLACASRASSDQQATTSVDMLLAVAKLHRESAPLPSSECF